VIVRWFRPLKRFRPGNLDHRTHRKVMVVDEEVGFTGGVGIADVWLGDARNPGEWRDTHFRIRGPVVDGLRAAFLDNWIETDPELFDAEIDRFPDQPQPGSAIAQCIMGASEVGYSDVRTLTQTLLQIAQHRVRLATAYFVPDDRLTECLAGAADNGVTVELLLPGPHIDKRFVQIAGERSYERLLARGVRIWHYQPTMLHAKVMTIDGLVANIGSANFNYRSTGLDEEVNVVALDRELVATLDAHFDDDFDRSVPIDPETWTHRSLTRRAVETALAPVRRHF
jgi:cardiolipin synthase